MERVTRATIRQIELSPIAGRPAKTIFFGGGTPTYLPSALLVSILEAVLRAHPPIEGCEITSEANPGTVDASKFEAMRAAGFNRLSLGAQSFDPQELVQLGRIHSSDQIAQAVNRAQSAGFENINVDLIFGLPNQTMPRWRANLEQALGLGTEHISLYGLTIEPNTAFYKMQRTGQLPLPDEEAQLEMLGSCEAICREAGFVQYEISNYAKPGRECQHNLCYWRGEEYAGYGPGAVGAVIEGGVKVRRTTIKHPERFCGAVELGEPSYCEEEFLTDEQLEMERIMLGLRLNEGIDVSNLSRAKLDKLASRGWLEVDRGMAKLTALGRSLANQAIAELV